MKTFHFKLATLCFAVLFFFSASAQKIWVSPNGSDTGAGNENDPLKSISSALEKARELRTSNVETIKDGIQIILKAGDYCLEKPLEIKPEYSGTEASPTIIMAEEDYCVRINGGVKVEGWQKVKDHIYRAKLDRDEKLRTLFIDGKRMHMAGTDIPVPGMGEWGKFEIKGNEPWAFGPGSAIDGIKFSADDVVPYKNPEDIELVQFNVWTEKILCVRDMERSGDTTIVKFQQPYGAIATSMAWAGNINFEKDFVIRNAYELLDAPGEFYFNTKSKQLYCYYDKGDINGAEVIAPVSDGLVTIKGNSTDKRVSHIQFKGIVFSYDHWPLMEVAGSHGFAGIQSLGLAVKYIPDGNWHPTKYNSTDVPTGAIQIENAANISFIRNRFQGISSAIAINLVNDVKHCTVEGNFFNDLLGNAVNIGHPQHYEIGDGALYKKGVEGLCEYNLVSNNYIRNVSLDFRQVEAITSFFVANTRIEHNDISGTPYGAITCGWWWGNANIPPSKVAKNNSICYNKVGNTHQVLDDGGVIYLLGEQPGTKVEENYIFNGPRCIYPDDGSAYLTIARNVVDNPSYTQLWLHFWTKRCHDNFITGNYVKNNLFMDNGTNNTIKDTHSFREDEFSGEALEIMNEAGIEDEFKDIVPGTVTEMKGVSVIEPGKISIHPKDFKERDVFH
ncbi:hypothetical protein ACE1ET_18540 [Saccharicrinis sp. FJH62]|uniref:hypothetical protein n=1 Tax=Saccharicrinis sp. FJH62 TaxID=3344657 RepID=UPI0035D50927